MLYRVEDGNLYNPLIPEWNGERTELGGINIKLTSQGREFSNVKGRNRCMGINSMRHIVRLALDRPDYVRGKGVIPVERSLLFSGYFTIFNGDSLGGVYSIQQAIPFHDRNYGKIPRLVDLVMDIKDKSAQNIDKRINHILENYSKAFEEYKVLTA